MSKVFTAAGCQVLVCDLNQTLLDAAKKECPALHATVADVSDEASVAALFEQVRNVLGGLDVRINNAGIAGTTGYVETLSKADWDRTLDVKLNGPILCARPGVA